MPRVIPKNEILEMSKRDILQTLIEIDRDRESTHRILQLENRFREWVENLLKRLPSEETPFLHLHTNPYVLLIHSLHREYSRICDLEKDMIVGKAFSNIETSVGRMLESVILPTYGWEIVDSEMHTAYSEIDGKHVIPDAPLELVTLKSGPRCINDSMSGKIAQAVVDHYREWADDHGVDRLQFTVGIAYGTTKQSNKKDWHILEQAAEQLTRQGIDNVGSPVLRWDFDFLDGGLDCHVQVKIGAALWHFISGNSAAFIEIATAFVRSCVIPLTSAADVIESVRNRDLHSIVSVDSVPGDYNVSVLQRSQLPWLFLLVSHYCDQLTD